VSAPLVTVAIPVLNGAEELEQLLPAIRAQRIAATVEIVVADSESEDRSADVAREHGATVVPVRRPSFSHGGTRNLLMERSAGDLVAFLTQDAQPAHDRWLAELTGAFGSRDDVALAFGPGLPRPGASLTVRRELTRYFGSLSPEGRTVFARLAAGTQYGSSSSTYFHSVNACIARDAWEQVPFRVIPYAEDRMLALDMLRAGWAKAFVPGAAVLHSHDYQPLELFRRSFDEWRGLREVVGHREPTGVVTGARWVARQVKADMAFAAREGMTVHQRAGELPSSVRHACLRHAGAVLGSRASRLSPVLRRACSLEGRDSFVAQQPRPASALPFGQTRSLQIPEPAA
jgi:glycosyltransferase involved in cell wall biosynthesis